MKRNEFIDKLQEAETHAKECAIHLTAAIELKAQRNREAIENLQPGQAINLTFDTGVIKVEELLYEAFTTIERARNLYLRVQDNLTSVQK